MQLCSSITLKRRLVQSGVLEREHLQNSKFCNLSGEQPLALPLPHRVRAGFSSSGMIVFYVHRECGLEQLQEVVFPKVTLDENCLETGAPTHLTMCVWGRKVGVVLRSDGSER